MTFDKYTLSQRNSHCTRNCIFWHFLETENSCFVTKNCSKAFYICVFYFFQKIAGLVLERLPLLGNGWSFKVV